MFIFFLRSLINNMYAGTLVYNAFLTIPVRAPSPKGVRSIKFMKTSVMNVSALSAPISRVTKKYNALSEFADY